MTPPPATASVFVAQRARLRAASRAVATTSLLVLVGPAAIASAPEAAAPPSPEARPVVLPPRPAWLIVGGGSDPASNQVSLAQDVALARSLLRGPGAVLFAGGTQAPVAELGEPPGSAPSEVERFLADFFGGAETAGVRFRDPGWRRDGPATAVHVRRALEDALRDGSQPLLVYVTAHGSQGESPAEDALDLWGGWRLSAAELAEILASPELSRSARFVVTSCFGGGFAEIAFRGADPSAGPPPRTHCGLFATPWDDEAAGCDPNPVRREQEAYGIHFLHALAGQDRNGTRLPPASLDLDGDGAVSLLEAHTRARIAARSFDLPTTTSERWLRARVGEGPRLARSATPPRLPEEKAVVEALSRRLGFPGEAAAQLRLGELDRAVETRRSAADAAQAATDDAWSALRIALLERWPELARPWLPSYRETVRVQGAAILELVRGSQVGRAYRESTVRETAAMTAWDDLRVERAAVERLVRAHETIALATALAALGGPDWRTYEDLLACERWVPPVAR